MGAEGRDRPLVVGVDARDLQGQPTGTGRYLRSLLTRAGKDRYVLYMSGPPARELGLPAERVRVRVLQSPSGRALAWQERVLPKAVEEDAVDVFFSPAYTCPLRLRIPRVTTVHDMAYFSYPQDFPPLHAWKRRLQVALSIQASARIVAVSDFTRREIAARFPAAAGRVVHVPHGTDDDLPAPPSRADARARLGLSGPYVVTVGSLFNRRCIPELLRAATILRRRHPGLVLDVVGDNRTTPRLDLAALVNRLGLSDHVRLSGFVDEAALADRYAAADAAVFLSEYEGFGLPALEAATRGVPLVVSDRPSLSEIFGQAALVVNPRDEDGVAGALDRVLTDPGLVRDLVARGRALAAGHSWARTARLTREALLAAVQG